MACAPWRRARSPPKIPVAWADSGAATDSGAPDFPAWCLLAPAAPTHGKWPPCPNADRQSRAHAALATKSPAPAVATALLQRMTRRLTFRWRCEMSSQQGQRPGGFAARCVCAAGCFSGGGRQSVLRKRQCFLNLINALERVGIFAQGGA